MEELPPSHSAVRPGKPLATAAFVALSMLLVAGLAIAAVSKVRTSATQTDSANKLKQFGLGFHNFDSAQGRLPPHAILDEDGRKLANWRFSILPYILMDCYFNTTEGAFKYKQPWDSEHNLAAIPKMDKEFAAPGIAPSTGLTHYHAFDGENTPLAHPPESEPGWRYKSRWTVETLANSPRGTSNIVFCIEAGPPSIWTHPDGLPYATDRPLPPMVPLRRGIPVLKADGSVVVVRSGTAENVWRAYIDPATTSDAQFE